MKSCRGHKIKARGKTYLRLTQNISQAAVGFCRGRGDRGEGALDEREGKRPLGRVGATGGDGGAQGGTAAAVQHPAEMLDTGLSPAKARPQGQGPLRARSHSLGIPPDPPCPWKAPLPLPESVCFRVLSHLLAFPPNAASSSRKLRASNPKPAGRLSGTLHRQAVPCSPHLPPGSGG